MEVIRSAFESHAVLRSAVAELNPHAVEAALYDLVRAGLPGSSMSDGRGGGEPPLPGSGSLPSDDQQSEDDPDINLSLLDQTDREVLATLTAYQEKFDTVATALTALCKLQRDVLAVRDAPVPKTKVHSLLKDDADEYDRTHNLDIGTTWAQRERREPPKSEKIPWCLSCLRIKGHLCPIAGPKQGGKEGVLCWWCIRHRAGDGWPDIEHVRAHAEGRPVRVKVKQ